MGNKKPRAKSKAKDSPAEVARAAGCSRQLAHRLLQRGMTRSEIIARVAEQNARKADLMEFPTTAVSATNGHAAADGMLSYAGAQASKENWSAALRKLEHQKKCGELVPVRYMRRWGVTF
jgi:hypothetical protein